jgi:hypothetical protein
MSSQTFEQELEDTVQAIKHEAEAPTGAVRSFTAIPGNRGSQSNSDLVDSEHLIALAQQRYDRARKTLDQIELEHQLERTKLIQIAKTEIADLAQKAQRKVAALDAEFERRKGPARRMMALVSRLSDGSGE